MVEEIEEIMDDELPGYEKSNKVFRKLLANVITKACCSRMSETAQQPYERFVVDIENNAIGYDKCQCATLFKCTDEYEDCVRANGRAFAEGGRYCSSNTMVLRLKLKDMVEQVDKTYYDGQFQPLGVGYNDVTEIAEAIGECFGDMVDMGYQHLCMSDFERHCSYGGYVLVTWKR